MAKERMTRSVLRGKLCAALCDHRTEPLAHVQLVAFAADLMPGADLCGEPALVGSEELAAQSAWLLGRATTDDGGGFALELSTAYRGGPLALELWCSTVPGRPAASQHAEPCGLRLAVITPSWRRAPGGLAAPWDACLSATEWGTVRERFDAHVLCGRVRGPRDGLRGAVHVTALWQSEQRCAPIGEAFTDASGRFRIDYPGSQQRERERQIPGGNLVFRLDTADGDPLPQASPRKVHALDLGQPCSCAHLALRESPRLVPLAALHPFWSAAS